VLCSVLLLQASASSLLAVRYLGHLFRDTIVVIRLVALRLKISPFVEPARQMALFTGRVLSSLRGFVAVLFGL